MKGPTSLRRLLERELVSGLGRRRRRALVERVRGNDEARRGWDRAVSAFRMIERREVSNFEIEQVERWLFDDLEDSGVLTPSTAHGWGARRSWTLAAAMASLATAAAAIIWIGAAPPSAQLGSVELDGEGEPGFTARGARTWSRPLALELVCGEPPRPVGSGGCAADDLLGFSARLGVESLALQAAAALGEAPLQLSVFGLDAHGELLYYAPTPEHSQLPALELDGGWTALPMSVRLEVNHSPGLTRVFALASEQVPTLAELDEWGAALAQTPVASVDDPPWHLRLGTLTRVCPRVERCASAETEFTLAPASAPGRTTSTDESGTPP